MNQSGFYLHIFFRVELYKYKSAEFKTSNSQLDHAANRDVVGGTGGIAKDSVAVNFFCPDLGNSLRPNIIQAVFELDSFGGEEGFLNCDCAPLGYFDFLSA